MKRKRMEFEVDKIEAGTIYFKELKPKKVEFKALVLNVERRADRDGKLYLTALLLTDKGEEKWNCFDFIEGEKIRTGTKIKVYGINRSAFKKQITRTEVITDRQELEQQARLMKKSLEERIMRTEAQKKMDLQQGLSEVEYSFDVKLNKIVEKGTLKREYDAGKVEEGLPFYFQQVDEMTKQAEDMQKKLGELKGLESNRKVKEFLELQQKAAKLMQKKQLEEALKKKLEELEFHKDNIKDQIKLVEEWKKSKK